MSNIQFRLLQIKKMPLHVCAKGRANPARSKQVHKRGNRAAKALPESPERESSEKDILNIEFRKTGFFFG